MLILSNSQIGNLPPRQARRNKPVSLYSDLSLRVVKIYATSATMRFCRYYRATARSLVPNRGSGPRPGYNNRYRNFVIAAARAAL